MIFKVILLLESSDWNIWFAESFLRHSLLFEASQSLWLDISKDKLSLFPFSGLSTHNCKPYSSGRQGLAYVWVI